MITLDGMPVLTSRIAHSLKVLGVLSMA